MQRFIDPISGDIFDFDDDIKDISQFNIPEGLIVFTSNNEKNFRKLTIEEFKAQVQSALDKTDSVALRCLKAGVVYPQEWKDYTATLRTFLNATTVSVLPTMPNYPQGS